MKFEQYFYNCSREYVSAISPELPTEISSVLSLIPVRKTQAEINDDLFWLLTRKGWAFDTLGGITATPPADINLQEIRRAEVEERNDRSLCLTATTLEASWHCDFAKRFPAGLVQVEVQFGKVESMFKDFCGFRLARYEKRLALGIEIVMHDPYGYFAHRRNAIGGMAYFDTWNLLNPDTYRQWRSIQAGNHGQRKSRGRIQFSTAPEIRAYPPDLGIPNPCSSVFIRGKFPFVFA